MKLGLITVTCIGCWSAPAPPKPIATTLVKMGLHADWLDRSVDPCVDFYRYACGGWEKANPIPADRPSWSVASTMDKDNAELIRGILEADHGKPGKFYAACMDERAVDAAGIKPLQPLLDVIAQVHDRDSLVIALATLHRAGVFPAWSIGQTQDFKDATKVIASIDQSGLGLPDREYYVHNEDADQKLRGAYYDHVIAMMKLAGPTDDIGWMRVFQVETFLAESQQSKVARRDPHEVYHRVDRATLAKLAPHVDWTAYFKQLGFPEMSEITINSPHYLEVVDSMIEVDSADVWKPYLTWTLLHAQAATLGKAFADEEFQISKLLSGQATEEPRWRRCVRSTDRMLGQLVGRDYVAKRFAGDSKQRAEVMMRGVQAAFGAELATLAWMDRGTRDQANAKLSKMFSMVGAPERIPDYAFEVGADFAGNMLRGQIYEQQRQLAKVGKPVDKGDWGMTPTTIDAYYDFNLNAMVFPAAILQPPWFSKDYSDAVNYGATAPLMGHELSHGFDDQGAKFDGNGNLADWWSKQTAEHFKDDGKCVIDQYARTEPVPGTHTNGELTLGENIADIAGVKIGLAAFHSVRANQRPLIADGLTEDQVFFLAYAHSWCRAARPESLVVQLRTDPHSAVHERVNLPLANLPAFGAAFHCPADAPLRPANVCEVW